jgi:Cu-Zn family superoxide dismutase
MDARTPGLPSGGLRRPPSRRALVVAAALVAALAAALAGCGDDDPLVPPASSVPDRSSVPTTRPASPGRPPASDPSASGDGDPVDGDVSGAALRDPHGVTVGSVLFEAVEGSTRVTVQITDGGEANAFHGLVIHANDDPSNGEGCQADPGEPPGTWFVSADGHLVDDSDEGGLHQGDLPNVWVMGDGSATTQVLTDRLVPSELVGAAVVLHALPSNYGNVPVGDGPGQYTPNSERSQAVTEATGNTGNRLACGVIEAGGGAAGSPVR